MNSMNNKYSFYECIYNRNEYVSEYAYMHWTNDKKNQMYSSILFIFFIHQS